MPIVGSGSREFDTFKQRIESDQPLKAELEDALRANINRLDPSDRANRFGSGGAVEWIIAAAAFECGIVTLPAGHNENGTDLIEFRDHIKGLWSIKNSSQRRSDFRISNGMGGEGRGFSHPLLLLSPSLPGIVYADPKIHSKLSEAARSTTDAVVLPFAAVLSHSREHPECVIECNVPENTRVGTDNPWMDYVKSLLDPLRFPRLARLFETRKQHVNLAEEIRELAKLRAEGQISQSQFDQIVYNLR